jgi:hypothetical protein
MRPDIPLTHEDTAWILTLPSAAASGIALLLIALVFASQSGRIVQMVLSVRKRRTQTKVPDPALIYHFQTIPGEVLSLILLVGSLLGAATSLAVSGNNLLVAMLLAPGFALVPALVSVIVAEQIYVQRLDNAMISAIGRLLTQMRAGNGFQIAFSAVTNELDPGPIKTEWQWILDHIGVRLSSGSMAMVHTVCEAMALQTPSTRHAAFLLLLESALQQPFSEQLARINAAYVALSEGVRRNSMMKAELSQMRNSGIALFLINVFITGYLAAAQFDRFITAYSSPFGPIVAVVLGVFTLSPLIAGQVLAQFDDIVY